MFKAFKLFSRFYSIMENPMLLLFDVDGTLTLPRQPIQPSLANFLTESVAKKAQVALVGGSDFSKIFEQFGGEKVLSQFVYVFSENGLVAHKYGKEFSRKSIQEQVGEIKLQQFINFALRYMSELELPVKRGTFIEFRTGLINVCPVGRSCTQTERDDFEQYDKVHKIREEFVSALRKKFPDLGLVYTIGGQISFDVFPIGWDKTYCLNHIPLHEFSSVHFFGDKTSPGGNDHALFIDPRVIGHSVTSPEDTREQVKALLNIK